MNSLDFSQPDLTSEWTGNLLRGSLIASFELTPKLSLVGSLGQQVSSVWFQEYSDNNEVFYCGETSIGCFDPDFDSTVLTLSFEYRMGRLNEFYQRFF